MTREEAIEILQGAIKKPNTKDGYLGQAIDMAIKALEQETSKDEYIKVPKKALKYRTAGMVAYNAEWLKNHFDIERAVICGTQEPCEDAISIQVVIEWLKAKDIIKLSSQEETVRKELKALPPVTPKQRTGHWVGVDQEPHEDWECYRCGHIEYANEDVPDKYHFCPNCGAKMVEPQESEESDADSN